MCESKKIEQGKSAGRGRPPIDDAVQQAKIIAAARKILATQREPKLTIAEVAVVAGMAKKTVYRFVTDRYDLIDQVERNATRNFDAAFGPQPTSRSEVLGSLRSFLLEISRQVLTAEIAALFRLLASDADLREMIAERYRQAGVERAQGLLANWLRLQNTAGLTSVRDPAAAANLILSMTIAQPFFDVILGARPPIVRDELADEIDEALGLLRLW